MLAFPQADIDIDIWMELPEGMIPLGDGPNRRLYILKLNKNLYGRKQASHNWYEDLKQSLFSWYFTPSNIDPCIFMKDGMLLLVYGDDFIIIAESEVRIDVLIRSIKNGKEKYILSEEGSIHKFLSICISKLDDNKYELEQPLLIGRIVEFIEGERPTELNDQSIIPS